MPGTLALELIAHLPLAAASGLALRAGRLEVVADDSLALHRYAPDGRFLDALPLLGDAAPLPADPKARKKAKPDFEAAAVLPDGSLLVLGSGSRPNRCRGSWLRIDGQPLTLDLAPLYRELSAEFRELNVEGAAVCGAALVLAQRGNGGDRDNALIVLALDALLRELPGGALGARGLRRIARVDLGRLDGVPLSFTDLAADPDGALHFTAAAEDTTDPYEDGLCAGSVLGRLDGELRVARTARLRPDLKVEGLHHWRREGTADRWLLVADADRADRPSPLMSVRVPADAGPPGR
ncbi:MAG: hypothetical protein HYV18_01175 [Gammaproteobacteria bacterium]|nr:hypothetical protein [Gammaproteobacteria bacterium]